MSRLLVFQHVAAEPLGTLDPLIRRRGHRVRFKNYERHPDAQLNTDRYRGLIVPPAHNAAIQVTDSTLLVDWNTADEQATADRAAAAREAARRAAEEGTPELGPIDIVLVVQSLIVLFIAAPPLVRSIFRLKAPTAA